MLFFFHFLSNVFLFAFSFSLRRSFSLFLSFRIRPFVVVCCFRFRCWCCASSSPSFFHVIFCFVPYFFPFLQENFFLQVEHISQIVWNQMKWNEMKRTAKAYIQFFAIHHERTNCLSNPKGWHEREWTAKRAFSDPSHYVLSW